MAIFAGKNDELSVPKDCKELKKKLGRLEHFEEMNGDHMTFFVAEDASYFTERAMNIIKKFHPSESGPRQITAPSNNLNSTFL